MVWAEPSSSSVPLPALFSQKSTMIISLVGFHVPLHAFYAWLGSFLSCHINQHRRRRILQVGDPWCGSPTLVAPGLSRSSQLGACFQCFAFPAIYDVLSRAPDVVAIAATHITRPQPRQPPRLTSVSNVSSLASLVVRCATRLRE
jgi:hypothetical protein